ncbi:hypothetical protein E2562_002776 [Oryza meyeriana var. granulata]|uniref:Uncharacterized protein n=1 Tax=Oryza meyeriana var. granulata TaxID=110450 RepID=A0A6G1BRJ8_9ORYZ|nr:hypothetical protein E2562_002776 [Oryza meyeriana var. granulata]
MRGGGRRRPAARPGAVADVGPFLFPRRRPFLFAPLPEFELELDEATAEVLAVGQDAVVAPFVAVSHVYPVTGVGSILLLHW